MAELVRAVYVGDDGTDENAFRSLRGIGRSVWVGSGSLADGDVADFHLPDPAAVRELIDWLTTGAFRTAPAG